MSNAVSLLFLHNLAALKLSPVFILSGGEVFMYLGLF